MLKQSLLAGALLFSLTVAEAAEPTWTCDEAVESLMARIVQQLGMRDDDSIDALMTRIGIWAARDEVDPEPVRAFVRAWLSNDDEAARAAYLAMLKDCAKFRERQRGGV